jgi:hypothetical protein
LKAKEDKAKREKFSHLRAIMKKQKGIEERAEQANEKKDIIYKKQTDFSKYMGMIMMYQYSLKES